MYVCHAVVVSVSSVGLNSFFLNNRRLFFLVELRIKVIKLNIEFTSSFLLILFFFLVLALFN
jgi:hypothetical protein